MFQAFENLPFELLARVAKVLSAENRRAMAGVCHAMQDATLSVVEKVSFKDGVPDWFSVERYSGVTIIKDAGWFEPSDMTLLHGLRLVELESSLGNLEALAAGNFPLEKLSLFLNAFDLSGAIHHLATFRALTQLDISFCGITDEGLEILRHLPLKSLNLFGNTITDAGLVHLVDMPLRNIILGGFDASITSQGLALLQGPGFGQLRELYVTSPAIESVDWTHGLQLDILGLEGCANIKDLLEFTYSPTVFKSLRCLNLMGCLRHVEDELMFVLRRSLKHLRLSPSQSNITLLQFWSENCGGVFEFFTRNEGSRDPMLFEGETRVAFPGCGVYIYAM